MVVVVTRPDWTDTACKWGSWWMNELVVKPAREAGFDVTDLYADDATRDKVLEACKKSNFIYFSGVGHGNATTFTGQRREKIFWKDDDETCEISKDKHFNFLSCIFGKEGAKWMVEKCGAIGAHGYDASFIFVIDRDNFPNDKAKPFFDSHTTTDRKLFKGATHGRAHRACLRRFNYWIMTAPEVCRRYLAYDKEHKVFWGDKKARIKKPCFIVTATLGTHEKLQIFYWFRDDLLSRTLAGRYFIRLYYGIGPYIADVISAHNFLKKIAHRFLESTSKILKMMKKFLSA